MSLREDGASAFNSQQSSSHLKVQKPNLILTRRYKSQRYRSQRSKSQSSQDNNMEEIEEGKWEKTAELEEIRSDLKRLQSRSSQSGRSRSRSSQSRRTRSRSSQSGRFRSRSSQSGRTRSRSSQSGRFRSRSSQSRRTRSRSSQSGRSRSRSSQSGRTRSRSSQSGRYRSQSAQSRGSRSGSSKSRRSYSRSFPYNNMKETTLDKTAELDEFILELRRLQSIISRFQRLPSQNSRTQTSHSPRSRGSQSRRSQSQNSQSRSWSSRSQSFRSVSSQSLRSQSRSSQSLRSQFRSSKSRRFRSRSAQSQRFRSGSSQSLRSRSRSSRSLRPRFRSSKSRRSRSRSSQSQRFRSQSSKSQRSRSGSSKYRRSRSRSFHYNNMEEMEERSAVKTTVLEELRSELQRLPNYKDKNPQMDVEQRKSNLYPGGIPNIEISKPSSPPKAQKQKPKVSGTPKPGSGPGSVLRALASIYQGRDEYMKNREIQRQVSVFCQLRKLKRPTKDAVDTALSPNSLQRHGWIHRKQNMYCITQSGLDMAKQINQALEEKGTSENQQKTNILNEEIREDSMEAERMADAYDIDLNIHKIREGRNIHRGEDELSNDSISDLLIEIDEKQETEDDLDDKIDYAWDDDDADNGLNSVYVAQSSHVNTRTKKKALKQEVASEKDRSAKENAMNSGTKDETIGGCMEVDKNPLPQDDLEIRGDAESEELIPKEAIKEEVDDDLEDASYNSMENVSDNSLENASDNAMEDALEDVSQVVKFTMRTEPSPRVSKPPKFNGAPGYILRALDKYFTEGEEYTFWEIQNTVSDFCKSISIHLESIPTPCAITSALRMKSAKNRTRTMQENGWILKKQDGYMITELGRKMAKKLNQEAAAYKKFRGNSAPARQE